MDDCDWLAQEFKQAEREYRELPESARPVVVPPADAAEGGTPATEEPRDAERSRSTS